MNEAFVLMTYSIGNATAREFASYMSHDGGSVNPLMRSVPQAARGGAPATMVEEHSGAYELEPITTTHHDKVKNNIFLEPLHQLVTEVSLARGTYKGKSETERRGVLTLAWYSDALLTRQTLLRVYKQCFPASVSAIKGDMGSTNPRSFTIKWVYTDIDDDKYTAREGGNALL
jgi:hypothetical protein